jgi:hypothetical protein
VLRTRSATVQRHGTAHLHILVVAFQGVHFRRPEVVRHAAGAAQAGAASCKRRCAVRLCWDSAPKLLGGSRSHSLHTLQLPPALLPTMVLRRKLTAGIWLRGTLPGTVLHVGRLAPPCQCQCRCLGMPRVRKAGVRTLAIAKFVSPSAARKGSDRHFEDCYQESDDTVPTARRACKRLLKRRQTAFDSRTLVSTL